MKSKIESDLKQRGRIFYIKFMHNTAAVGGHGTGRHPHRCRDIRIAYPLGQHLKGLVFTVAQLLAQLCQGKLRLVLRKRLRSSRQSLSTYLEERY